jgi:hypothetical protein
MVQTGRGLHAYFRTDAPTPISKMPWGEVRGDGGYVVVPPSRHPSGTGYRWFDALSPAEVDLREWSEAEAWLPGLAAAAPPAPTSRRSAPAARNVNRSEASNNVPCFTGLGRKDDAKLNALLELAALPEIAIKILRHAGCKVDRIQQNFHCPLHEDSTPSASL